MDISRHRGKLLRVAPTAIASILATGAVLEILQTTRMAMRPFEVAGIHEDFRAARNEAIENSTARILQRVLEARLFGAPPDNAASTLPLPNLKLTGVLATPDPAFGWAFIMEGTSITVYDAGAELNSGGTLREIYDDRAVVERDGVRHVLPLEGLAAPLLASADDATDRRPNSTAPVRQAGPKTLSNTVRLFAEKDHNRSVVRLYSANGPKGLKDLYALGLIPGDQIIAVDGSQITGNPRELAMLSKLQAATLTIQRGRKQVTVRLP